MTIGETLKKEYYLVQLKLNLPYFEYQLDEKKYPKANVAIKTCKEAYLKTLYSIENNLSYKESKDLVWKAAGLAWRSAWEEDDEIWPIMWKVIKATEILAASIVWFHSEDKNAYSEFLRLFECK